MTAPALPRLEADIVRTLSGFSLALRLSIESELLVLFGPSGAGKSLTLQAIAGVDRPDGGRIVLRHDAGDELLFDQSTGVNLRPQARRIGYVPQSLGLFPHLSVQGNVTYGLRRRSSEERDRVARRLLALMRLSGLEHRRPGRLSGGQQQRVALARALAIEPRLLLLDEPLSSLDRPTRRELGEEVRRIQRERAIPVVLVTHDLEEAYSLADRVAVIDAGRVLQLAPRDEVFGRPASRRVAELIGIENVLDCTVRGPTDQGLVVEWGPLALQTVERSFEPGARVSVAIAASQIRVLKPEEEPHAGRRSGGGASQRGRLSRPAPRARARQHPPGPPTPRGGAGGAPAAGAPGLRLLPPRLGRTPRVPRPAQAGVAASDAC